MKKIFIVFLIGFFCGFLLWQKSLRIPYFADEYDYVSRGIFLDMMIQRDFTNPRFRSYDSYVQEKLPSYFYRSVLYIFRTPPPAVLPLSPSWGKDSWCQNKGYTKENCMTFVDNWMWNDEHFAEGVSKGNLPVYVSEKLLPVMRARIGAWMAACIAVGIFFIFLYRTWGFFAAIAGVFLLTLQPVFEDSMLKAMGDGLFVLFLLGALYCCVLLFLRAKKNNMRTTVGTVIFVGICSGLSMSSKMIGILGCFLIYGLVSQCETRIRRYTILFISIALIVACSIFFLLHPFIWNDPIRGMIFIIHHRMTETILSMNYYSQFVLPTVWDRMYVLLTQIVHSGMSTLFPYYFGMVLDSGFFIAGIIVLVRAALGKNTIQRIWARFFLFWCISTFIVMIGYMGLRWTRYYMPFILCIVAVQAVGVSVLLRIAGDIVRKQSETYQFRHQRFVTKIFWLVHIIKHHGVTSFGDIWAYLVNSPTGEYLFTRYLLIKKPRHDRMQNIVLEEIYTLKNYETHLSVRSPVIVDIGANIGLSMIYFYGQYPHAAIIGYEANPELVGYLRENISHNTKGNITYHNDAVVEKRHAPFLYCPPYGTVCGALRPEGFSHTEHLEDYKKVKIHLRKLSSVLASFSVINILKIDVEETEYEYIPQLVSNAHKIQILLMEFHIRKEFNLYAYLHTLSSAYDIRIRSIANDILIEGRSKKFTSHS